MAVKTIHKSVGTSRALCGRSATRRDIHQTFANAEVTCAKCQARLADIARHLQAMNEAGAKAAPAAPLSTCCHAAPLAPYPETDFCSACHDHATFTVEG